MLREKIRLKLLSVPRREKQTIVLLIDVTLSIAATWIAFSLQHNALVPYSFVVLFVSLASITIGIPIFIKTGLYRAIYRYSGWNAVVLMMRAHLLYASIFFVIFSVVGIENVPRYIGVIQPLLLLYFIGLSRYLAKYFLTNPFISEHDLVQKKYSIIYGAGAAGRQLASGLCQNSEIKLIAFVDDNPTYAGSTINGVRVYLPYDIPHLMRSYPELTDIFLAIPSLSRFRQREILSTLSKYQLRVKIVPGLGQLISGHVSLQDVREVEVEDILGRAPVRADENFSGAGIEGKVVLVTGAGGSIGSELCRQILKYNPKTLLLFDLSESSLFVIERELSRLRCNVKIIPILGSVVQERKLARVIRRFGVNTVYHAAAYKHVPMIEANPAAGVWNNVFGTLRAVEASCVAGVDAFVLVSTDKAVRPTNVMGCSKRLSELVLQAKNLQYSLQGTNSTRLTMVRFGNVLGSSGSVVPIFREQIKSGGPVTVTHPEIIRYFMTIPEAAQLVIQAGAMGEGGDVMVLDMGEPVKIVDLAKRLIHLSGFSYKDDTNTNGDIQIRFTGLRPGEKLYEELLIGDNTLPTSHPRILRAAEHFLSWEELEPLLFELEAAIKTENSDAIRSLLKKAVPEFNPQSENGDVLKKRDEQVV